MSSPPATRRVLMLLQNSPYSEDGRVLREARALRAAGHDVAVICPRAAGEPRRMQLDGVELYQFTQCSLGNGFVGYALEYGWAMTAAAIWSLWVAWRRGFDVLHAHNPPDLFVLIAAFWKLFGKRFVFDQHDLAPEMFAVRFGEGHAAVRRVLLFFERLSCRLADHVIATNESYRQLQVERDGLDPRRSTVVRNGPEAFHFRNVEPHPSLRDVDATVIGYVGEMGRQDGIDCLVRALGHLHRELGRTDWLAVMVGDGEVYDELRQLAADLHLAEHIRFTGRVSFEEVVPYLASMDICTAPDPANGYNDRSTLIKVMEYMAQGKPTVAFDLTETRYSAADSGVYVTPNDELLFARALQRLMDDPAARRTLGEAGRRRAADVLAWEHSASALVDVYATLGQTGEQELAATHLASTDPTDPAGKGRPDPSPPVSRHDHCNV